jgi:hypothetical protein
MQTGLSAPNL